MKLSSDFIRSLIHSDYKDQYNQVPATKLEPELFEQVCQAYSSIKGVPPKHCPFTVLAAKGGYQDVVQARLAKNASGELVITWGTPDEWLTVSEDQIEFDIDEETEQIICFLKGYPEITFSVYREDLTKNRVSPKGVLNNIKSLSVAPKYGKIAQLEPGNYTIVGMEEKNGNFGLQYILTLEGIDGKVFVANKPLAKYISQDIVRVGSSFSVVSISTTVSGYDAANIALI